MAKRSVVTAGNETERKERKRPRAARPDGERGQRSGGAPIKQKFRMPSAQPDLPPTARRLLQAARVLLERSGYDSLSVEAIGREAGENKALIRYYFGDKNGLLVALVDWLMYDWLWEVSQQRVLISGAEDQRGVLIDDVAGGMLSDPQSFLLFFDLLPHLLENRTMAAQLAELYRAYRDLNIRGFWEAEGHEVPEVVRHLAAMTVALVDGLGVQVLAEPGSVDVRQILTLWKDLVERTVADAERTARAAGSQE